MTANVILFSSRNSTAYVIVFFVYYFVFLVLKYTCEEAKDGLEAVKEVKKTMRNKEVCRLRILKKRSNDNNNDNN